MTYQELEQLFNDFNQLNVLIIGDVMIDSYYKGSTDRISPEAPVPVVNINKKEKRLGGAANVALNIQSLGANPILCTVIGNDETGKDFESLITTSNLSNQGIVKSNSRKTTLKTRVIAGSQQVLRFDEEDTNSISAEEENQLLKRINSLLEQQAIDVVIFEDYNKGLITTTLIEKVVNSCNALDIPTTVDPKKIHFLDYKNVTLFKPNLKELKEGLKISFDKRNINELNNAIDVLQSKINAQMALVTLSEMGVIIKTATTSDLIDAHIRNISDVSGAGDTVISVASLALALKMEPQQIAKLANLAGGLVCEKVGVVPINKEQLLHEAKNIFQ